MAEDMRDAVVDGLADAIRSGQIEVWMQPLVDFAEGEIVAAEVLTRWNHPEYGYLAPDKFIPALEQAGKIGQLDRHVWRLACQAVGERARQTGEPPLPFSVNVSRAEILARDLIDYLEGLCAESGLPEGTLRLEVTETAYVEQPDELVRVVTELREHGFLVEMDDFGSGYSSLNMLRSLPVDILKLDMGFLRNGESDSSDAVILNSVIRMAHGLNIPIIAEGVETIEQAEMLKTMGCKLMQGYFFAKPMPYAQYFKLLDDTRAARHAYEPQLGDDRVARLLDQRGDTAFFFSHCAGPAFVFSVSAKMYSVMLANDELYGELQINAEEINLFQTDPLNLIAHDSRDAFRRATRRALVTRATRCTVRLEGGGKWVECTVRAISVDEAGGVLVCYVRDATEESHLERAKEQKVMPEDEPVHDEFTGLLTLHSLDALVMGELGENGGTLILVDVDDFDQLSASEAGKLARKADGEGEWVDLHRVQAQVGERAASASGVAMTTLSHGLQAGSLAASAGGEAQPVDSHREQAGMPLADAVIEHVAFRLGTALPKGALLARCGECLFAAFIPGLTEMTEVRRWACSVIDMLRTSSLQSGQKVTCSMGLSSTTEGSSAGLAIRYRRALRALTIAKLNGGDGFLLYDTVRDEADSAIEVFGVPLRHAADGELLPERAFEGKGLFEVISRDFDQRHGWGLPADRKHSVRDAVFGALRYRSMAEIPGILSFDYDVSDDAMFFETVKRDGELERREVRNFHESLFSFGDKLAEESMARLSALISDIGYLPSAGNVDLKCRLNTDQDFRWYRFSFTSLRDDKSLVVRGLGYGEDIDLSRESGLWWKDRAMHDGLTGLLNREGLEEAVQSRLAKQPGGIMFMVDIDDFKDINDALGHLSGDSVLCEVATTLQAMFREEDAIGRFGADEMIAFISGFTARDLAHSRGQALVDMATDICVGNYGSITVSVGVAVIDGPASFYDFLELADRAVHISKAAGKNRFTVADETDAPITVHELSASAATTRTAHGQHAMEVEARFNREREEH